VIEPLTPREAAATRELRSVPTPAVDQPSGGAREATITRGTAMFGTTSSEGIPSPIEPPLAGRETRELAGQLAAATPGLMPEASHQASAAPKSANVWVRIRFASRLLASAADTRRSCSPSERDGNRSVDELRKRISVRRAAAPGRFCFSWSLLCWSLPRVCTFSSQRSHTRVSVFVAHLRGIDTQAALEAAMKPKSADYSVPQTRPE